MDNLYNKIAFLCENKVVDGKKGVSFYRLCKDIGIRQSVLTDLKNGRTLALSTMTIDKLATYFNVSVGYLLGKEVIKKEPVPISENELDLRLIEMLTSLTPDEMRQVDAFVQGLLAARKA